MNTECQVKDKLFVFKAFQEHIPESKLTHAIFNTLKCPNCKHIFIPSNDIGKSSEKLKIDILLNSNSKDDIEELGIEFDSHSSLRENKINNNIVTESKMDNIERSNNISNQINNNRTNYKENTKDNNTYDLSVKKLIEECNIESIGNLLVSNVDNNVEMHKNYTNVKKLYEYCTSLMKDKTKKFKSYQNKENLKPILEQKLDFDSPVELNGKY